MHDDLRTLTDSYLLGADYSLGYRRQFRSRIEAFIAIARITRASELRADPVNEFLESMQRAAKWSNHTIRGYRTNLLTLWMYAADQGLTGWPPRRIRRIKTPLRPVECWTLDELRTLIATGSKARGGVDGMLLRHWWPPFVRCGYATALRCGDLLRLKWSDLDENGAAIVIQSKVDRPVAVKLPTEALDAADRIRRDDRLLPWPISVEMLRRKFAALVDVSEIPPGTIKGLRIAAITHAEAERPGSGKRLAGHSNEAITQRHYTGRAIVLQCPIQPPPI